MSHATNRSTCALLRAPFLSNEATARTTNLSRLKRHKSATPVQGKL